MGTAEVLGKQVKIGDRQIGQGAPCLIVAEVGLAHDGSANAAHSYIDAVAKTGADAVKFQCHLGDLNDRWRIPQKYGVDRNRLRYWDRTGFDAEEWAALSGHARETGLIFLCSPFSVEAVRMLDPLVEAWKIPSGKVTYKDAVLEAAWETQKPLIMSFGMDVQPGTSEYEGKRLLCTSIYPCPPDMVGLDRLAGFDGLSDHSGTIWPSLAAVSLGAEIVEVHVCFSRDQWSFDSSSSITMDELTNMAKGIRFIEKALKPVDKMALARELTFMRAMFGGARV